MERQNYLRFYLKISSYERKSYEFRTTWGRVINDRILISGYTTIPLMQSALKQSKAGFVFHCVSVFIAWACWREFDDMHAMVQLFYRSGGLQVVSFFYLHISLSNTLEWANETCQHSFVTHTIHSLTELINWQLMNAVRVSTDGLWHDQYVLDVKHFFERLDWRTL